MSCNEWEEGTIILPAREAVRVRDAMKGEADRYKARLYDRAQTFWKALPAAYKRDVGRYRTAISAFIYGNDVASLHLPPGLPDPKLPAWRAAGTAFDGRYGEVEDLQTLLGHEVLYGYVEVDGRQKWKQNPPRRVQKTDVAKVIGKTTGVRFTIHCGEPSISFHGRQVTWSVPENNHAVEHGRDHPLAQAFFKLLDTVTWTRGSGGDIVGNDEYNRDSRENGGGGNYTTASYFPDRKSARRIGATR